MKKDPINIQIENTLNFWHYFLPGSSIIHNFEDMKATFSFDFLEKPEGVKYILYFEFLCPNYADMLVCKYFECKIDEEFFIDYDLLRLMAENSYPFSLDAFKDKCASKNIILPQFEFDIDNARLQMRESIAESMPYKICDNKAHKYFLNKKMLNLTPSETIKFFLTVTVGIIDQLLLLNPDCDRIHNREMIFDHAEIPFVKYLTLRYDCLQASRHKASFSIFETISLMNLADCAVQFLLSPLSDKYSEALKKINLSQTVRKDYITIAAQMRAMVNKNIIKSRAEFPSLSKFKDWPDILK